MNFDSILIFLIFTTYGSFCWKLSNNDFECPFCSIKESSACHLISHINNEHTENEITICPECYKEFQYGSILEVHIHLNHAEKNTLQSVNEPDFLYAKQLQQQFDKEAFEQEDNERQRKFKEKFLEPPTVKNITEHIRRLSENSPEVRAVYLASPTDYYMSARADLRYGCVFRSLQMLLSSVILNADYQNHIVNMWIENCNTIISRSRMPNVSFLEYHLEESWNKGIHNWRKGQLYSRSNFPTKQGCVEADMDAIFLGMRIKSEYIIFQGGYYRNRLDDMLNWLRDYFRNENGKEYLPPITLLYPWHAVVIVGVEIRTDNSVIPLIVCPNHNYNEITTQYGMNALNLIRLPYFIRNHFFYKLCIITGIIATDAEYEMFKRTNFYYSHRYTRL